MELNDKNNLLSFIEKVDGFSGRYAIQEGKLHFNEVLRGNSNLGAVIAAARRRGFLSVHWHKPAEFEQKYAAGAVLKTQGDNELQEYIIDLLRKAYEEKASDIHIINMGNYALIKMRILGLLTEYAQLDAATGDRLAHIIYNKFSQQQNKTLYQATGRQDSRIANRELLPDGVYSVRTHSEPIQSESPEPGMFMALRLLYDSTKAEGTLDTRMTKLGFEPAQIKVLEQLTNRGGLSLISGPTGHGKSTLLKHVMESMVENVPQKSYFSVEDPPEYVIHGVCQIQVNTESQDTQDDPQARARGYRDAIAGALRSDPDVIMIGEIRYAEAADASIQAALTGHGIWATIHASDAFAVVSRLAGLLRQIGIDHPLDTICNSSVLSGLCYQRLLPVLCPNCKRRYLDLTDEQKAQAISPDVQDRLNTVLQESEQWENLYVVGDGCEMCRGRGNVSMTVAAETVLLDQELLHMLQEGRTLEARRRWKQNGGISYVDHAIMKIGRGLVDPMAAETRLGVPLTHSMNFYEHE